MRLLHIITTLDPAAGGTTEAVRLLVEHAPPDVHSEVLTLDRAADPFLPAFPAPVHAVGAGWNGYGEPKKLQAWLDAHAGQFDGAVVHGLWNASAHAARKSLAGRLPYIVFAHGMLDPYFKRAFPLKHAKKWLYWLSSEFWNLKRARYVAFTTQLEAELAGESFFLHSWKPVIVPLGTTPLPAATAADHAAFAELVPGVTGRRFLLFLGRLHPKKGVDLLLHAFLQHAGGDPALDLVMAGPVQPTEEAWLEGLRATVSASPFAGRIYWPGMLRGAAKRGALDLCEAFVLPSHQENFGIAVVEALAAGKPVLLADKINIWPDVARADAGLVEPDTAEGTRRLLERWRGLAPEARAAMGKRALALFESRYDIDRNAAELAALFGDASR